MRILYIYEFDVTKKLKREEVIEFALNYMKSRDLSYQDICFRLCDYKLKDAKRKNYFEKLVEADPFWKKYYSEYDAEFAKSLLNLSLSNLYQDNWERCDINDDMNVLLTKINEQMSNMPKGNSFKIAFI